MRESNWPGRSHTIGSFQKSWSELVAISDENDGTHVNLSLDGSVLDSESTGEAFLSIILLISDSLESTAARQELSVVQRLVAKLGFPGRDGNAIEQLKFVMTKIESICDMLDEASQVRLFHL